MIADTKYSGADVDSLVFLRAKEGRIDKVRELSRDYYNNAINSMLVSAQHCYKYYTVVVCVTTRNKERLEYDHTS